MTEKLKEEIRKTLEVLRNGGVILYPTDTIWGLGCDATNDDAVRRIFEIKKRSDHKSMLVLLEDAGKIAWVHLADVPVDQSAVSVPDAVDVHILSKDFIQRLADAAQSGV